MVVYPCSANTLAKMAHGINDNAVTMAVNQHLEINTISFLVYVVMTYFQLSGMNYDEDF